MLVNDNGALALSGASGARAGLVTAEQGSIYIQSIARSDGGVPFVLPSAGPYPRAPWWKTEENPASSLLPTVGLAAILHKHAVDHPWVEVATDFCWRNIDGLEKTSPYEVMMVLQFLENVDDRARAEESFARIGPMIHEQGLAELDPQAPGEILTIEALMTLRAYGRLDHAHLTRDSQQLGGLPPAALLDWEAQRVGHPDEPRGPDEATPRTNS